MLNRLDLVEAQVEHWHIRLEPQSVNGRTDRGMVGVHTSMALQEELQAFMRGDRARMQEVWDVVPGIEERVNSLRRSRDDTRQSDI